MAMDSYSAIARLDQARKRVKKLRDRMYAAENEERHIKDEVEFGQDGPTCDLQDVFYESTGLIKAGIRTKWKQKCLIFFKPATAGGLGGYSPNVVLPYDQAVELARFILNNPPTPEGNP